MGLSENPYFLKKIQKIRQYRFLKITLKSRDVNNRNNTVHCPVNATVEDPWTDLRTENGPSFLKFIPYLAFKTPYQLTEPANGDDITTRIELYNTIIPIASMLRSLIRLSNEMYRTT